MDFNDILEIKKSGFEGFIKIQELWNDSSFTPKVKGVYLVWNPYPDKADFLSKGSGGISKVKTQMLRVMSSTRNSPQG
ncbi:MAG: hypothetical protein ABJH81_11655 [Balneola sp.]